MNRQRILARLGPTAFCLGVTASAILVLGPLLYFRHQTSNQRSEDILEAGLTIHFRKEMRDGLHNGEVQVKVPGDREKAQKFLDEDVARMEKLLDGVSDATLLAGYKKKRNDLRQEPAGPPGPFNQRTVRLAILDKEIDRLEKRGQ